MKAKNQQHNGVPQDSGPAQAQWGNEPVALSGPSTFVKEKLKKEQIARLHEERFTRDVCPGVLTEDWILAWHYRQPCFYLKNATLKPEFFRTATGQTLCATLLQYKTGYARPSLRSLDHFYREQAEEHPERAQEMQRIRDHIARLFKIPYGKTHRNRITCDVVLAWYRDRYLALHPNRKLSTGELEDERVRVQGKLDQVRQNIDALTKVVESLSQAACAYDSSIRDLVEELNLRAGR
jgi:hypothetical protein